MGALDAAPGDSEGRAKLDPKRGGLRPSDWLMAADSDDGPGPWYDLEADLPGSGVAVSELSLESN